MSGHKLLIYILGLFLLLGASTALAAGDKQDTDAAGKNQAASQPKKTQQTTNGNNGEDKKAKIVQVTGTLRHGASISVELTDLKNYPTRLDDLKKYVLVIDGIELITGAKLPRENVLVFDINNKDVPKDTWGEISRCVSNNENKLSPMVDVKINFPGKPTIYADKKFQLLYMENWEFWSFVAFFAALVAAILILGKLTALLRDPCPGIAKPEERSFSLGKCQMAFWFVIILPCFIYIWLITGSTDSLAGSTVVLLSISTMTTVLARFVDTSKKDKKEAEITDLQNKLGEIEEKVEAASPEERKLLEEQRKKLEAKRIQTEAQEQPKDQRKSRGFFSDILGDNYGINFHRFQCAMWTGALGIIFLFTTFCSLDMPDFSETILALLGISNGTYLALKVPEK